MLRPGRPRKVRENNSSEPVHELLNEHRHLFTSEQGNPEENSDKSNRSEEPQDNPSISVENRVPRNDERAISPLDSEPSESTYFHRHRDATDTGAAINDDEYTAAPTTSHPGSATIGSRRQRKIPAYLQDYEHGVDHAHSLTCTRIRQQHTVSALHTSDFDSGIINLNYFDPASDEMASEQLNQAEMPIDILEEGEVMDAVMDTTVAPEETKRTLSGSSIDRMQVRDKTVAKVASLFETLLLDNKCSKKRCTYESNNRERMKIHSEAHYLIYVAPCTFFSSNRDSVKRHVRKQHQADETITQVDRKHWSTLRKQYTGLPVHWPKCPVAAKEHCLCRPAEKEKSNIIQLKRVDTSRSALRGNDTREMYRIPRRTDQPVSKRPSNHPDEEIPRKRRRLSDDLATLQQHLTQLRSLVSYLEAQASCTLNELRKLQ